jgi:hypothetical protein
MTVTNYPQEMYFIIAEDSPSDLYLGRYQVSKTGDFTHALIGFFIRGTSLGTEALRVNVYSTRLRDNLLYSSEWVSLSQMETLTADWFGKLRFDFDRSPVSSAVGVYYHFFLETSNYTRDADNYYIGVRLDWPFQVNASDVSGNAGADINIFTKVSL